MDKKQIRQLMKRYSIQLLSVKSVTSDAKGIEKAFTTLEEICKELDFCYERNANGKVMRISNNPMNFRINCKLALIEHIDTVDYQFRKWSHNPLGEILNDRIFGRGIIDDKGAVVLSLLAAKTCENCITKPWVIVVGSCEEGIWTDMEEYKAENHPIPDYATTIDGDGVQFGCRGYADVEFAFQRQNHAGIQLKRINIPNEANNVVPGLAQATFSDGITVSTTGRSCHSSAPQNGKNALIFLANKIEETCQSQFPGFFHLMKDVESTKLGNLYPVDTLDEIGGQENPPSTVCPTICSIQNDVLKVNLNFRLSVGVTVDAILNILYDMAFKYHAKISLSQLILPAYMNPESIMIKSQLKAYQKALGHETTATLAPGTGYNAAFEAKYGCNIFGPRFAPEDDEEDLCHCDDESRSISDLMRFYKMLCIFLRDFLA